MTDVPEVPAGTDLDTELLFATVRNMADLYWMGQAPSTVTDPRVERSWGGGACPEQHWGHLKDGRCFYLRMRHGWATLQLGPAGLDPNVDLPLVNPLWNTADFDAALAAGKEYPHSFFAEPRPGLNVYPEDPDGEWAGFFYTPEDRDRAFTTLLDEIEAVEGGTGTGWCAPSP